MSFKQLTPSRRRITLAMGGLLAGAIGVALSATPAEAVSHEKGEVEGIIANRSGSCPNLTFTVLGTRVTTSESTKFEHGSCNDLADGKMVEVKVPLRAIDGKYNAYKVELKK